MRTPRCRYFGQFILKITVIGRLPSSRILNETLELLISMARRTSTRDLSLILTAAEMWMNRCLIKNQSVFLEDARWTPPLVDEVYHAFVDHPDSSGDDFLTKLKKQMRPVSAPAQQLVAEMLW